MRGKLAIGITANFVNQRTSAEEKVQEIRFCLSFRKYPNITNAEAKGVFYGHKNLIVMLTIFYQSFVWHIQLNVEAWCHYSFFNCWNGLLFCIFFLIFILIFLLHFSGVAYIFNQQFFKDMKEATGVDLENIVYYKDETHYFVMCAKKQSLLEKGVIIEVCC